MTTLQRRRARLQGGAIRLGQFSLTKELGAPIDFVWPCTNSGDGDGVAFIKVLEGGSPLWVGPPFTVPVLGTVGLSLHQTIDISLGVHNLIAEMWEGLPPAGDRLIESDTVGLTVVSNPVLASIGPPTINGIEGATSVSVRVGIAVPVSWPCQNTGGGTGRARIRAVGQPGIANVSNYVTIPGFSTVILLRTVSGPEVPAGPYTVLLTMEDGAVPPNILDQWTCFMSWT